MPESSFSAARGRRFALTLAIAFGVIAAIAFWRERRATAFATATISTLLLLSALLMPGRLEPVERAWMRLGHTISRVTTPIFMGIVYFLILTPAGLVRRIAGANSLVHRPVNGSYWIRRAPRNEEKARAQMERQF